MLTIRNAQLKAFGPDLERAFMARAVRHLGEAFSDKCAALGPGDVSRSVESGMRKARGYGLESEVDILRYLNLMYTFGFEFDVLPWAKGVLADMGISADAKMDELMENAFAAEAALSREPTHG
jgi:hypothetical protein